MKMLNYPLTRRVLNWLGLIALNMLLLNNQAMATEKVCFPNHKGLPYDYLPPTIDGYVAREFGITTSELEQGWNGSSLVSHGEGGSLADVEFRGLKHNSQNYIYLSFVVRFDEAFDNNDAIVLLLRPAGPGASHINGERRIHIFPLYGGAGAGNPDDPSSYTAVTESGYDFRKNATERSAEFYKWTGGAGGSFVADTRPSNTEIKVRSWNGADKNWSVEIKLPTTTSNGGTGWLDIPADFGLYFDVIRVCDTCGSDPVTGYYSNQFSWPRADYSVDPPTGVLLDPETGAVLLHEIPIEASWIGDARMLSAVTADCGGVRLYGGHSAIGARQGGGAVGTYIHATDPNTFVVKLINDGTDDANGVRAEFRIANWGISSTAGAWSKIDPDTGHNNPTARTTIPADAAVHELTTQWTLNTSESSQYGTTLSIHQCVWVTLDSNQGANFSQGSYWNNMNLTGLSSVTRLAEINASGWGKPAGPRGKQEFRMNISQRHLFHPGLKDVQAITKAKPSALTVARLPGTSFEMPELPQLNNFQTSVLREVRANVNYGVFPRFDQAADLNYYMLPQERVLLAELLRQPDKQLWEWVWQANVSRKTTRTLTLNQKKYRVYEPAGQFGYLGLHQGLQTSFSDQISNQVANLDPAHQIDLQAAREQQSYVMYLADGVASQLSTQLKAEPMKEPCKDTFCKKCPRQSNVAMSSETALLIAGIGLLGFVGIRSTKRHGRK